MFRQLWGGPMTRLCEFYECIQGEGRFTGTPMWLVRLQGCDVGCPWCDTKESWDGGGFEIDPAIFIPRLREANQAIRWAMITGGEPCLQNLNPFTAALVEAGMRAALETSGTSPITGTLDWITVSPKVGMPGHKEVLQSVLERADEIKMPVGAQRDIDNLLTLLAKGWAQ